VLKNLSPSGAVGRKRSLQEAGHMGGLWMVRVHPPRGLTVGPWDRPLLLLLPGHEVSSSAPPCATCHCFSQRPKRDGSA
jgi:hypothetical protein